MCYIKDKCYRGCETDELGSLLLVFFKLAGHWKRPKQNHCIQLSCFSNMYELIQSIQSLSSVFFCIASSVHNVKSTPLLSLIVSTLKTLLNQLRTLDPGKHDHTVREENSFLEL